MARSNVPNLRPFPLGFCLSPMPFLSASGVSLAVEIQSWDFYFVYRGRHDFSGTWLGLRSSLFQQIAGTGIKEEGEPPPTAPSRKGVCGLWGKLIVAFLKCRKHSE